MGFPFGKAPLCILLIAIATGLGFVASHWRRKAEQPDLTLVTFAKNHYEAYSQVMPDFEKRYNVKVHMQLVNSRALESRLQSALLVGAEVPDVVEILDGTMGYYTKGPLEDVGFVDLTDVIKEEGFDKRMVASRFSKWTSRGHIFAMPHDVHPVTLAYRRDIIEDLGIDVTKLETWDDFAAMGRRVTKDLDGDGVIDRYAIDMPSSGDFGLMILILQKGGAYFDAKGEVAFDSDIVADVICWYVEQTVGENRISTSAGWGQPLAQAMIDGLALFYFTPDWRTQFYETDVSELSGKMALMPLPAWEKGGRRTSVWGGTGMTITKKCGNFDLAWKLAKFLYCDPEELGKRFTVTNIIPPLKDAWDLPEISAPRPYYGGQRIGKLLAELALEAPDDYVTAYTKLARSKVNEAYANAVIYYEANRDKETVAEDLRKYVERDLKNLADYVRTMVGRNKFLSESAPTDPMKGAPAE